MAITSEKVLLNNQSILQNFGFGEEIDEQAAEIISGGCVTLRNTIDRFVLYRLDGCANTMSLQPGQEIHLEGNNAVRNIDFDMYAGSPIRLRYIPDHLCDGQTYEFQRNLSTADPDDINLYPTCC
jgi:hypothetical protein